MLKVENVEVIGWEHAIRGMRNPKNSWAKSDSGPECPYEKEKCCGECQQNFCIGPNDKQLMMALRNAGTDHRKFMRMITVYLDITAPLYWWNKIAAKEFTLDDFSHEHLCDDELALLEEVIARLNMNRIVFIAKNDKQVDRYTVMSDECYAKYKKTLWWQMIQLLPTSYNQKRTVMLNYEVLANIYKSRQGHKLTEWHEFIEWIEGLPYTDIFK